MYKKIIALFLILLFIPFVSGTYKREVYDYQGSNLRSKINYSWFDAINYTGTRMSLSENLIVSGTISQNGSTLDETYLRLDTENDPLTGNLNLGNNNIDNINYTNTSYLYLDYINDDYDINGTVNWNDGILRINDEASLVVYDTDGEPHLVDADLERFDELRTNTFTVSLDISTFSNSTGTYINISGTNNQRISFVLNIGNTSKSERFNYSNIILKLTSGTNSTPVLNRVYVAYVDETPTWFVTTSEPTVNHAMASRVMVGDEGFVYSASLQEDGNNGILKRIQRRFRKEGLLYELGFDYNITPTELYVSNGSFISGVYDLTIASLNTSNNIIYTILSNGSYVQYDNIMDLLTNGQYASGESFGSNKYVNIVFGIIPYNGYGRFYAVVQNKPPNEYTSTVLAYADSDNTLNVYPSSSFERINFLPIVRSIFNTASLEAQLLPNGYYGEDYRGGVAGGVSSGGGLAEADPLSIHKDGSVELTANWDAGNYEITSEKFNANDWTNVTITESQISDFDNYIPYSDEPNLNVNSSNYWDDLNSPADITTSDITDDGKFLLSTGDDATGDYTFDTDTLVIDSVNNRVGIGTDSPSQELQISSSFVADVNLESINGHTWGLTSTMPDEFRITDVTSGQVPFRIEGATRSNIMYLETSGKIGIGTNNPEGQLHIFKSDVGVEPITDYNDLVIESAESTVGMSFISTDSAQSGFSFGTPSDILGSYINWGYNNNLFEISTANENAEIVFKTDDRIEAMRIDSNGNVGIGTTTPSQTLEVNGNTLLDGDLIVNGNADFLGLVTLRNVTTYNQTINSTVELKDPSSGTTGVLLTGVSGEDNYFNNGGNVLIGTSTPTSADYLLEVNGVNKRIAVTDDGSSAEARIGVSVAGGGFLSLEDDSGSTNAVLRSYGDSYTLNDFSVGIDTPATSFHVYADTTASGATDGVLIDQDGTGDSALSFRLPGFKQYVMGIDNSDSDKFKISDGASFGTNDRFVIDGSGNVGISTNIPDYKLTINSNGDSVMNIKSGDTSSSGLLFGSQSDIAEAGIVFNSDTNKLAIRGYNYQDRIVIDSTGNVGIGTASPSEKLNILGNTGGTFLKIHDQQSNTGDLAGIKLGTMPVTQTANMKSMIAHKETGNFGVGDLIFAINGVSDDTEVTDANELMRIKSSGKVGIGTDSPDGKLEVKGTISSFYVSGTGNELGMTRADANYIRASKVNGTLAFVTDGLSPSYSNSNLVLQSNKNSYFNGNLGIGINNQTYKLQISTSGDGLAITDSGDSDNLRAILQDSSGNGGVLTLYDDSEDVTARIRSYASSGVQAYFTAGNIGFGTAVPNAKVNIYSDDTSIAPQLRIENDGTGDASASFVATGVTGWSIGIDNDDSNKFKISQSATGVSVNTKITIDGGNVGIGTNSPETNLHIKDSDPILLVQDTETTYLSAVAKIKLGESDGSGLLDNDWSIGYNASKLKFDWNDVNRVTVDSIGRVGIGTASPDVQLNLKGTAPYLRLEESTSGAEGNIYFTTTNGLQLDTEGNTYPIRLDGSKVYITSNVGIGTTSPSEKLDVNGSVAVSDLAGTYTGGSAYVCVYDNGTLFASETACP